MLFRHPSVATFTYTRVLDFHRGAWMRGIDLFLTRDWRSSNFLVLVGLLSEKQAIIQNPSRFLTLIFWSSLSSWQLHIETLRRVGVRCFIKEMIQNRNIAEIESFTPRVAVKFVVHNVLMQIFALLIIVAYWAGT